MESEKPRPALKRVKRTVKKQKKQAMESSKEHFERQQPAIGGFSDMKRVKESSAASVAELREFLGQLKGRSPQEVMGVVAQSSLVQGIMTATIATGVILLLGTVIPYAWFGGPDAAQAAEGNDTTSAAVSSEPSSSDAGDVVDNEAPADATDSNAPDLERAAKAMGIDQTKSADPETNPLDNKLDNLLDGIE